ncbi:two-component system sensor histidine kinase YesM [Paenibacillus sp. V4I3]|uniref:cache domain-containing sensor histidine kinase n=1 Tax=unclassified Paenibacillus TaxID=185978 RepID=UPI0027833A38|nr:MULTISPECIES: sensor histidine kinase [unclassified Paenibacillus]MDQ0872380.1 two-component system sensor histidine kinase YesM [Paenibacillus sp. V4I3]MDQ0891735.1 two-component system sensor histidine kinase YesM [Paenibacillus sp. V4I9]
MKRKTLSGQIYTYFLIVIVLSLLSVGAVSYWQSSRALDDQVKQYMEQMVDSANYQTDSYLQAYELLSNAFSSNSDVRNFMEIKPDDAYEYYVYSDKIKKFSESSVQTVVTLYKQLNMIYVVGKHGRSFIYENQNLLNLDPVLVQEQFDNLMKIAGDGKIALLNMSIRPVDQGSVVTMARKVRGPSYGDENRGVVAIEIKLDELAKTWDRVSLGKKGFFFIVDDAGNYIYPRSMSERKPQDELSSLVLASGNQTFLHKYNGEERMFVSRKSGYSDWNLVASMPVEELRRPANTIRTTTIIVGLVTLAIALWLAYRFGRSIIAPIRGLKDSMRETEKGNWQYIDEIGRTDEIGGLIHSYNLMVTRLSDMIERVYEAELEQQKNQLELGETKLERQRAEFQSLQLQINPHFLYNTLETINCYAIVQDSGEITEMVEAMAFMLRYSVQTNLEEITVANELNHVRNYMIVLQHRTGKEFEIDVAIPPGLLLEKMVRLTLQPLIENIFQHAFPDGVEPHHFIRIDARKEGGLFQVSTLDNGTGIKPERLAELRTKLEENRLAEPEETGESQGGGIGLMNVHRRIQMVFGEAYGLSIDSEWGRGTCLTMTMPETVRPRLRG